MFEAGISVCMHWRYLVWGVEILLHAISSVRICCPSGWGREALREQEAFPLCNGICCTWIGSDDCLVLYGVIGDQMHVFNCRVRALLLDGCNMECIVEITEIYHGLHCMG